MAKRKTIEVKSLFLEINRILKESDDKLVGERKGLCHILEKVLMETGHYAGFNHIYWMDKGCEEWHNAGEPSFPEKEKFITGGDDSRRQYFWKD